jgi:hypothetical protein
MAVRGWLTTWTARKDRSQATENCAGALRNEVDDVDSLRTAQQCALALELAGQALDSNATGGSSLPLGQLLLREALLGAAQVITGKKNIDSLASAASALQQRQPPESSYRHYVDWKEIIDILGTTAPVDAVAVTRAEVVVTQLVDEARCTRRYSRFVRYSRWVMALLAIVTLAVLTISYSALRRPWLDYTWFASSAWPGFPQFGKLSDQGPYDLIFHTNEEESPWVVVDLGKTRSVKDVRVINRVDWGSERGLPLKLELAGDDRHFITLGIRSTRFDEWHVTFATRKAHYLRLQAAGVTILHLREIQIR